MKQVLNNILERLVNEIPALKYVDENWGQLDYYAPEHPVKHPCALVDIDSVQWDNLGNLCQSGLAQVRITVANMKIGNTSGGAPATQRQKAFEIFDLMGKVHRALHGWAASEHAGSCTRATTRLVRRDDGIKQYEMLFDVQLNDYSASPKYGTTAASPVIKT
jgi:hypothetical protein